MLNGRREIFTDYKKIDQSNIVEVLRDAVIIHSMNAMDCDELINIEKCNQNKLRVKVKHNRTEIDNWVPICLPHEITSFKVNYNWGNPVTFVQRGENDNGIQNEADAITILNEYYDAQNERTKWQKLSRFVEICGIGYTLYEINTDWEDGESPFTMNVLDPRFSFVIKSNYYSDHRVMVGVTFRVDKMGNKHYTCYTNDYRFEITNTLKIVENDREKDVDLWDVTNHGTGVNPIHRVPIVEWIRDYDLMGCFERQMDAINAISKELSCMVDDTEQNTNALFWGNDIEFPIDEKTGETIKPKDGDFVLSRTTMDGKIPKIEAIVVDYKYNELLQNIQFLVDRVKIEAGVPLLSGNVSNTTGVAESNSSGWANAEADAERQDEIKFGKKMEELKIVLSICKENIIADVDEKVLALRFSDVKPSTSRQKNYEMSIKSATLANLINIGIYGKHAIETVNMFDDNNQVWVDSREMIEAHQKSMFSVSEDVKPSTEENVQTTDGGLSAQIENSPNIDGMKTEKVETVEEQA